MRNVIADTILAVLGRRSTWRLGRSLYLKARFDPPNDPRLNGEHLIQRQLLMRLAERQEEAVVFDVGANVGEWTEFLLQEASRLEMERRLTVHAFEPIPSTFAVLKQRIEGHRLRNNVRLVPQALSNAAGSADMFLSGETAETNSLHPDAMTAAQARVVVHKSTADLYCSAGAIESIHYLKCDTEGHDMDVLRGAERLFREQRVMACQFEYNHRWVYSRHFLKDVFDLFTGTPYRIGKITTRGVELYDSWHPELERFFEGNYLLFHPEARGWFPSHCGRFDTWNTYSADQPARRVPAFHQG
jgi:FkbM family methyltransferase